MKHIQIKSFLCLSLTLAMAVGLLSSCAVTNFTYLQDIQPNVAVALQEIKPIMMQPGDKVSIVVYSRDNELAQMFNMTDGLSSAGHGGAAYTIDKDGKIDMPILGPISVVGLTRMELANVIKYKLMAGKLVRDPIVSVEFANMRYYTLGEMGSVGRHEITEDHINILEAISECGDLTVSGKRENIMVLRTENGRQTPYYIDLTSVESVYSSPVFYLQQGDIIYVEPTVVKANQSKLNYNATRTPAFWFSMFSTVTTIILFLVK